MFIADGWNDYGRYINFRYPALLSVFSDTTGTELRLADLLFCKTCLRAKKAGDRCRNSCFRDIDSKIAVHCEESSDSIKLINIYRNLDAGDFYLC